MVVVVLYEVGGSDGSDGVVVATVCIWHAAITCLI